MLAEENGTLFISAYHSNELKSSLYRSTTDGITWDFVASFPASVNQIAVKPNGYIFVNTFPALHPLYVSKDSGRTWAVADKGISDALITGISVLPNGDLLAVDGLKGLHKSSNNGASWELIEGSLPLEQVFDVCVNKSGYLFVTMPRKGLYASRDNGDTWKKSTLPQANDAVIALAAGPKGEVYGATLKTIIVSSDNGVSWQEVCQRNSSPGETQILALDDGTLLIRAMSDGMFRSADGGATWHKVIDRRGVGNLLCTDVSPDGYIFVGTGDGAVFRSGDKGEHWELVENAGLK
jgi:photosystem II stability/assembly factor-like uncharacterized protein